MPLHRESFSPRYSRRLALGCLLGASLFSVLCVPSALAIDSKDPTMAAMLALEGGNLSSAEAERLERILDARPHDLRARTQLLGYYFLKAHTSEEARTVRQKHILWILENCPDAAIAGTPYAGLDPVVDAKTYETAKRLWRDQLTANRNDTDLLGNAARFFAIEEPELATDYLNRAQVLEPLNADWPERLGRLYLVRAMNRSDQRERRELMGSAMRQLEHALELVEEPLCRAGLLADLAKVAFEAGNMDKAKTYAAELLSHASQRQGDWSYGHALHIGNLILGRIALQSGNITQAKGYLLRSTNIPSSPHLRSFGPNMSLANDLLVYGENEVVIEYLRQCGKFWKQSVLNRWIDKIRAGKTPDFGLSLYR